MAYQKGLNKNRNHHDSLSQSGGGRARYDTYTSKIILDTFTGGSKTQRPYGEGKHKNGGKPKQYHPY